MFSYYNAPVIIPPVQPDIPGQGVPSDHSVPLCVPHTDPHNPPVRQYKTIVSRPLPNSKIREFGQWITSEDWMGLSNDDSPSEQVQNFENIIGSKLDHFFPKKTTKIGLEDKPYITSELKALKRKRMIAYRKHGKSETYERLKNEFEKKLKQAAEEYLKNNVENIKESNPAQKIGCQTW